MDLMKESGLQKPKEIMTLSSFVNERGLEKAQDLVKAKDLMNVNSLVMVKELVMLRDLGSEPGFVNAQGHTSA